MYHHCSTIIDLPSLLDCHYCPGSRQRSSSRQTQYELVALLRVRWLQRMWSKVLSAVQRPGAYVVFISCFILNMYWWQVSLQSTWCAQSTCFFCFFLNVATSFQCTRTHTRARTHTLRWFCTVAANFEVGFHFALLRANNSLAHLANVRRARVGYYWKIDGSSVWMGDWRACSRQSCQCSWFVKGFL